jgi:hypothetical protein
MDQREYKSAIASWFDLQVSDQNLAVTLTMKQNSNFQKLDQQSASQNLKHFLNKLNSSFFGNSFKRHSRRFEVLPILEVSNWQRLHYHLTIRVPEGIDPNKVAETIPILWMETRFGFREHKVEQIYSKHWIDYMMKKILTTSEIDIDNTYICR